ncbi:DNA polymerase Y family protein [Anaerolentibacter hominis]|uniref:DNA polymerase Y family protein n=1 Tax=Anaerolentibacter hominis TaxID=3079009 RepID=UPI0031B89846
MSCPRVIFHIDVNSAFLSWEAVYRLHFLHETSDLREIPSAVCGSPAERHGIVLAKSLPAKAYHIYTAQTINDALKLCPQLTIVPPRYALYEKCSDAFMKILRDYTPDVEQYSIDEAFMDMTGTSRLYGSPVAAGVMIKDRIFRELGFTVNIGISSTKLLAKMASDFKKPNLVHTLFPEELEKKMWPLPVEDLFSAGRSTCRKLRTLGIRTIGDLARTDPSILKSHFGKLGLVLHRYANGIDDSPVLTARPDNKGYGNSMTIDHDLVSLREMRPYLLSLCETVATRLRADDMYTSVVCVSYKDCFLRKTSHQATLLSSTHTAMDLFHQASRLIAECWDGTPVRQLGIHTTRLSREGSAQLDLFSGDRPLRQEKLEQAVDTIRARFGTDSIKRAVFLSSGIHHMNGGIPREKQNPPHEGGYYL